MLQQRLPSKDNNSHSASREISNHLQTRSFCTAWTKAHHQPLSWATFTQKPPILFLYNILQNYYSVHWSCSSDPFLKKTLYAFLIFPMHHGYYMLHPPHSSLSHYHNKIQHKLNPTRSLLCSLLQPPVTFSFLYTNILLSTVLLSFHHWHKKLTFDLYLYSSCNVTYQILQNNGQNCNHSIFHFMADGMFTCIFN